MPQLEFREGLILENIEQQMINNIAVGIVRYAGNARNSLSGAERPVRILLSNDSNNNSAKAIYYFKSAFEALGIEHGDAGVFSSEQLRIAFYELNFDLALSVEKIKKSYRVKIFERGETIGGLEGNMPGGVNFEGKVKSFSYGVAIPKSGIDTIRYAIDDNIELLTKTPEYNENYHEIAKKLCKKYN